MLPSISSTQFLLFYLILLFVPSRTVAYRWQICSTSDGHFTDNSTYEANLNLLLSSLVSNGSGSGFSTGTVGRVPNQVQGLVLCRGDTNATTCGSCLSNGAVEIRQICAYDRDAVVWYDECLLRFSNLQFLSTSDNDPTAALENVNQVNDDPDRFNKVVTELLDSTADWAAYNSTKRYATGQAFNVTPAFPTIYALAQCTPDMSASDCRNCLEGVSQGLPMARMGARNQGVRCNLRYESSLFFQGNPIIRLISPVTNATTPAENATTPASAPTSHPAVGPIGKEDQTDSEQATQVIESLLFRLATLRVATVNFAEANKLGEDAVRGKQLTWGIRYKIICGIARGLLYLHEESQLKIIHRDLKASNILLDADMNPKISDFGLAKLFDIDQTQGTTNRVMGTFGYMAPEYVMRGKFSIKSDVFSFGVLVLEILTGRKSNGSYNPEVTEVLLSYTPTMVPSMSSTPSLLFYLITLLLLSSPAVATQVCSTSAGKFTTNSTYESNLNLLLSSLISNGSASGFFTDTVGRMPNQVHGLVLCRGDTNATTCSSCLVTAGVEILQLCAYDKDAVVWYDDCHLRYSNLQFLSTLDNDPEMAVASEYQVYDETDRFNKVVNELMNRTADWAAYNSTKRQCLEGASQGLPMGRLIAKNLGVRCNLRCKVGPFFEGKPIIRLISALTNQTTPAENTTTPASAPASQPTVGSTSKEDGSESEQAAQAESLLFQISALRIATANFSEENKLGEGGFGAVYKGVLPDGREIAVKRLLNSGHGLGELKNELVLVAKLRHRNLVKLLGVCLEEEKMIVYEYVPNTSLDNFLFEYVMHGKYSIKSDVFGFGVLVLEILTGRKSSGSYNPEVIEVLLSYKTILAISISAVSAVLLLSIIYACSMRLRKQILKPPYATDSEQATQVESLLFDLSTLRVATVNFSEENKLGEGGFGAVYKGVLPDGRVIAVKRLLNSGQGLGELKNELALVAKLQHRNLVKLLGVCLEEEKMIVYEYVPNTSLDKFLFDPVRGEQLTWGIRYKIICGIARGLLYLHEESQLKIIHRDLKACNILLDADMNPKISDFGSAKLFDGEQTQGMTSRVVGTYGYMAPEYVIHGQFSIKSDVFSFGVLVLEILTGRKNSTTCNPENTEDLLSYTWEKWRGGLALEMENPFSRPTMSTITVMLNTVLLLSMRNPGAEGDGVVIEELLSMRTTDAVVKGNGMDTNRSSSIIHPCVGVSKEAVISPSGRIFCGGAATAEGVNGGGEASLAFVLRHVELAKRLAEDLVWGTPCRSVREAGGDGGRGEGREEEVEVGMVGAVGGKVGVCWTTFP
ncbi:Cysteine-rich receptor-like protein kinase [Musa troglodytarum]|uniref:Cysteine-rich receptor-like protein kinase n=1 Tax=Musa troglodytarum TaxID=320322 RepID=A0A9E7HCX4_9LILI|nr:Cysteine-rich receptor-like protein kinase [Musa troglodytarum]